MKKLNKDSAKQSIRDVRVGEGVMIYDFVNLYECEIGEGSRIGTFVEIQKGVSIGANCKISSHTFICEGVKIGDGVFVGHGVTFTNDKHPRATNPDGSLQSANDWTPEYTIIGDRVSIGSGSTILSGISVGEGAMIGAGSVVTKDVQPHTTVAGCPAKVFPSKKQ